MKIELTVSFDGEWVLEHRTDTVLPIAHVIRIVKDEFGTAKITGSTVASAAIVIETDKDAPAIAENIKTKLNEVYNATLGDDIVSIESRVVSDDTATEKAAPKTEEKPAETEGESAESEGVDIAAAIEELRVIMERRQPQKADAQEKKSASGYSEEVNSLLSAIDRQPGSAEFKALCHELADVAPVIIANNTVEAFNARSYLFVINDGCGLDDDLNLFAKLISATGIRKLASRPVTNCPLGPVKDSEEPFEAAYRIIRMGEMSAMPQILTIDISEWINATDNRFFKGFLKELNKQKSYIPVFRIPYVDKFVQQNVFKSLNDVMFVRSVVVPPYTHKELEEYAKRQFAIYGYTLNKSAWKAFFNRIDAERADGRFYGLDTVYKVVMELIYNKQLCEAKQKRRNKPTSKTIDGKAAATICEGLDTDEIGIETLRKLVGSAELEKRVNEIVAQIELAIKAGKDRPCIHMQFVGNPGTGKTTVARIVGKILKERGILSVGNFFEHSGRDFCGRYIGETAPKTSGMCRDAYGSVMFIDEAYSLFRGDSNDRDFGREALDTLIAEMENHRSDFVVIMAGYTDDMKKMMEGNSGLRSRVPYTIEFPNFTRAQLHEIFTAMAGKFTCEPAVLDRAKKYFDDIPDSVFESKDFANARFVRNLFERTWAKASMRCQLNGETEITLILDDFERAIADTEFKFEGGKQSRIGFRV